MRKGCTPSRRADHERAKREGTNDIEKLYAAGALLEKRFYDPVRKRRGGRDMDNEDAQNSITP
jgi:hypothetical protein